MIDAAKRGRRRADRLHQRAARRHLADRARAGAQGHRGSCCTPSGLPFTILRNGWYLENYTAQIADHLARGAIVGAAGDGRVSAASRADFAAAAAAVLIEDGHDERDLRARRPARSRSRSWPRRSPSSAARTVVYQDVSVAELTGILSGAGLDAGTAGFVAALDEAIARGDLYTDQHRPVPAHRPADHAARGRRPRRALTAVAPAPTDENGRRSRRSGAGTDGRSGFGTVGWGQLAAAVFSWLTNASALCAPESTSSEVSSRWSATSWVVRSK